MTGSLHATDSAGLWRLGAFFRFDRRMALLFMVLLLPLVIFWETASEIFLIWMRSDTFAHGIIIFPLALWLIAEREQVLAQEQRRFSPLGALLLAGLVAAWYLSVLASVDAVAQLALGLMMSASVLTVFGWRITRRLAFPLFYLLFAIPLGEFLIVPLMKWTAEFTVFALQVTGIPVYREGMFFNIPSGNFEVAKACSGIRYLIASVALGAFFANRFLHTTSRRLLFVAISIAVPVIANGFRAYGIVMLAHLSGMKLAVGVDHIIYGWVFFGLVMFIMFGFGWWLHRGERDVEPASSELRPSTAAVDGPGLGIAVALVLTLMILLAPKIVLALSSSSSPSTTAAMLSLPAGGTDWPGPVQPGPKAWQPQFEGASASGIGAYGLPGAGVTLFVAVYDPRNRATEMVSWQNQFIPEPWTPATSERRAITIDNESWEVRETVARSRSGSLLIWHWYETDLVRAPGELLAKVAETVAALPGRNDKPRAFALATRADEPLEQSRSRLLTVLEGAYPRIIACLGTHRNASDQVDPSALPAHTCAGPDES